MKKQEFSEIKNKVTSYVDARRLRDAFRLLRQLSEKRLTWEITDEINRVEESYTLMLRYAMQGADDPSRADVYEDIRSKVLGLLDRVERQSMLPAEPTLYYNVLRYEATKPADTIPSLVAAYRRLSDSLSPINFVGDEKQRTAMRQELEQTERRIFNRVWTSYPLTTDDAQAIADAMRSESLPTYFSRLMVGAIMLGGLEFFDEARLRLLMDAYDSTDTSTQAAALVALLLLMYTFRNRQLSARTRNRLESLREQKRWRENLRLAFIELIRSRDTDRLTRKMREEVVPEMLKLRSDITRKLNDNDPEAFNPELNPEWQERLEKTGVADKLKELSEIQEEGGDIYMATFGQLKNFPFFAQIANWFLPFNPDHTALAESNKVVGDIRMLVESMITLCDSDKYSLMLSVTGLPQAQRDMLSSQIQAQADQLDEMRAASMSLPSADLRGALNNYVKNLFRFFRLFHRKDEFSNPLDTKLNLTAIPSLVNDLNDVETLRVVAEFFFKREYYADAFEVFSLLEQQEVPSPELYQKMGYCRQQLSDLEGALDFYEKAELLDAKSAWTLRRLAHANKMLGRPEKALDYYRRLDALVPDSIPTTLNMGHCLVELERYSEAMKHYRKAEYLDEKGSRHLRPIAWCLFMDRKFEQSADYYDRILAAGANAPDYLNMGHLALARRNFKEALNFYRLNLETRTDGVDGLISDLYADKRYLSAAGVDAALIPLVIDAILYTRK